MFAHCCKSRINIEKHIPFKTFVSKRSGLNDGEHSGQRRGPFVNRKILAEIILWKKLHIAVFVLYTYGG